MLTQLHYTPYILPLAVSALFCLAMLAIAWRNRREPVAPWFAATLLALLAWTVGYIFELMAHGLQAKIAWANLEYIATIALPVFWLQVVLIYTRHRGLSRRMWLVLSLLGAALVLGVFINPAGLFRVAPALARHGSLTALNPDYGPLWGLGWVPFAYGLLLVAALLLVRALRHSQGFQVRQSLALLAASLLPLAAGTVYALGLSPWPDYNPAMAVVSVSGFLMAYALFSSGLFALAPLARDTLVECLADGVLVVDRRGRLVDANPAARATFPELAGTRLGEPLAELLGEREDVLRVFAEALIALEYDPCERPRAQGLVEVEIRLDSPSVAATRIYSSVVTQVRGSSGRPLGLALVLRDVSERVGLLDEARRQATTDALTGVLTRRALLERGAQAAQQAAERGLPLSVLVVDVDNLKQVNDSQGHANGDRLLAAVAAASRNVLREGDVLGRLGGDEFCVLLPGAAGDEARGIAERVRFATSVSLEAGAASPRHASVSIGVATCDEVAGDSFAGLLEAADRALYAAKNSGRDRVAVAGDAAPDRPRSRRSPGRRSGTMRTTWRPRA
jgi:diguanylate cyclase (GGDEF)-like protein